MARRTDDYQDEGNGEYSHSRYEKKTNDRSGSASGKKGGGAGSVITTILLIAAICVFAYSAWKLYGYWKQYHAGESEYSSLNQQYVQIDPDAGDSGSSSGNSGASGSAGQGGSGNTAGGDTESGGEGGSSGAGQILTSVQALEDEETLPEKIESAKKEEITENGTVKTLPELYNPIDFEELQKINPEVIGWIRVGGADISYPVAQTDNNEFYLHHTFRKESVFSGCIFENCDNSKFFTDQNTIIYGHNMKDGSMFAMLRKFWEDEDAIKNPYFWIFTPDFIYQYRIFSCSIVSKVGDPYRTRFLTEDFQKFIDDMKKGNEVDCGDVEVTTDDRIVTLSTCTGDDSTRRIVQGKLQQVYIAKTRPKTRSESESGSASG